eukprot:588540_1
MKAILSLLLAMAMVINAKGPKGEPQTVSSLLSTTTEIPWGIVETKEASPLFTVTGWELPVQKPGHGISTTESTTTSTTSTTRTRTTSTSTTSTSTTSTSTTSTSTTAHETAGTTSTSTASTNTSLNYTVEVCELVSYNTDTCSCGTVCASYTREYFAKCRAKCGEQILRSGEFGLEPCHLNDFFAKDMSKNFTLHVLPCEDGEFRFSDHANTLNIRYVAILLVMYYMFVY